MTGNVVNLRTARKQQARAKKAAQAAENRVVFGQTKAEKAARRANAELEARRLDQLKREAPDDGSQA